MSVSLASTTDVYYNLQISSVVSVNGSTYYGLIGPIAINVSGVYTPTIVYSNALISNFTQVVAGSPVCLGAYNTRAHTRPQLTVVAALAGLTVNYTTYTPPNNQSANIWTPVAPSTCTGPYIATDANNTLLVRVATGEESHHTYPGAVHTLFRVQACHPVGTRVWTT